MSNLHWIGKNKINFFFFMVFHYLNVIIVPLMRDYKSIYIEFMGAHYISYTRKYTCESILSIFFQIKFNVITFLIKCVVQNLFLKNYVLEDFLLYWSRQRFVVILLLKLARLPRQTRTILIFYFEMNNFI